MSVTEFFHAHEIDIAFEPHDWAWPREMQPTIDAEWGALTAKNDKLYDGRVLLLHRHELIDGRFTGGCFEAAFSAFNIWRKSGFPDLSVRNFFSMAALRSEDGAFLLGEMAGDTANPGQVYFPAGTPDPSDLKAGRADLLGSALRELEEETGLAPHEVRVGQGWDIVSCSGFLGFMRAVIVPGTGEAAAARIHATLAAQSHAELARIHVVRDPEQAAALRMPPFMLPYLRRVAQPG